MEHYENYPQTELVQATLIRHVLDIRQACSLGNISLHVTRPAKSPALVRASTLHAQPQNLAPAPNMSTATAVAADVAAATIVTPASATTADAACQKMLFDHVSTAHDARKIRQQS